MKKLSFLLCFFVAGKLAIAQSSAIVKNYIATYKDIAIEEMHRTGVPASITLAQGIHETEAGQSVLVKKSNNHFGIKCKTGWNGESVSHDDDASGECFRKYADPMDSYKDHSDFLKTRSHYAFLFKLDPMDYEAWAYGLKKAGYATNPKYPQILIKLIRDYNLQDYTLIALKRKSEDDAILADNVTSQNTESAVDAQMTENAKEETTLAVDKAVYPSGIFKINETNVLLVTKGTSFLKVAEENNISLPRLFEFNDMRPLDIADNDRLMFLQRKRKISGNEFHIVAYGETLYDIAQKEGIRMESLLEYNFLKQNMQPQEGEKLYLQTEAPSMPALITGTVKNYDVVPSGTKIVPPARESVSNNFVVYTVQPKETVYAIAKKYAVSINDLMKWNNMQTMELKTGQQLRINKK